MAAAVPTLYVHNPPAAKVEQGAFCVLNRLRTTTTDGLVGGTMMCHERVPLV